MEPTRTPFANGTDDLLNQEAGSARKTSSESTATEGQRGRIEDLEEQLATVRERLMGRAKSAMARVEAFCRDRPLAAVGIAVGAGFLLGRLSKRA